MKTVRILALAWGSLLLGSCQAIWGFRGFEADGGAAGGAGGAPLGGEAGSPSGGAIEGCTSCGECERCVADECEPQCEVGASACVGANLCVCGKDKEVTQEACASEELCRRSVSMDLDTCAPPECEMEQRRCVSNPRDTRVEVCTQHLIWEPLTDCTGDMGQCTPVSCIALDVDETEVSVRQYDNFVNSLADKGAAPYEFEELRLQGFCGMTNVIVSGECLDDEHGGLCKYCPADDGGDCKEKCVNDDSRPQTCVTWCQAAAFCEAQGRRLCGTIAGKDESTGPIELTKAFTDLSAWTLACAAGVPAISSAYGSGEDPADCIWGGHWIPGLASSGNCHPTNAGYGQFYNLSGSVAEWEDSCTTGSPHDTSCRVRGGSFQSLDEKDLQCLADRVMPAFSVSEDVGFRCCGR